MIRRLLLGIALLSASCGGDARFALIGTGNALEADGELSIEEADDGSVVADITLDRLPPAERVGDGARVYVVWFKASSDGQPRNVGLLEYDEATRTGHARIPTRRESLTVRVTGESAADVGEPSEMLVAEAEIRVP